MNKPLPAWRVLPTWAALAVVAVGGMAADRIATAQDTSVLPAAGAPPALPAAPARRPAVKAAAKSAAQIDAGEPRAQTSPQGDGTPVVAPTAAPGAPMPAAAARSGPQAAPANPAPAGVKKAPGAVDRLDLSTATVTGDREQPKVMYIVPWKSADIGDLSGKPMNSLLDEALAPVDRDEFKREVAYYGAVRAEPAKNGTPNAAAK